MMIQKYQNQIISNSNNYPQNRLILRSASNEIHYLWKNSITFKRIGIVSTNLAMIFYG